VDGLGFGHSLECFRSRSRDARQRNFFRSALERCGQFPIVAADGFSDVRSTPDLVTPKLAALHFYQLAIPAPAPPAGSFNQDAAARGKELFEGKVCDVPRPAIVYRALHTPQEIGIEDFQANRGPDKRYRTSPWKGLWAHPTGGFFHDGRFATLNAVVQHYNTFFNLGLSDQEQSDLVEYLKSL
jgi:hypothetical protein